MYVFPFSRHLFLSWWVLIRLNTTSEFQGTELMNYSGRRWDRINAPLRTLVTLKWWPALEIGDFEWISLKLCDIELIHCSDIQWQWIAASFGVRYHWNSEQFWSLLAVNWWPTLKLQWWALLELHNAALMNCSATKQCWILWNSELGTKLFFTVWYYRR